MRELLQTPLQIGVLNSRYQARYDIIPWWCVPCVLCPLRLRYFSPEELLRLFCFENVGSGSNFQWPEGVSTKTKYRLQ